MNVDPISLLKQYQVVRASDSADSNEYVMALVPSREWSNSTRTDFTALTPAERAELSHEELTTLVTGFLQGELRWQTHVELGRGWWVLSPKVVGGYIQRLRAWKAVSTEEATRQLRNYVDP